MDLCGIGGGKPKPLVPFTTMPSHEEQFLSFIDRCIEDDQSLVVPADEEQLERLADDGYPKELGDFVIS